MNRLDSEEIRVSLGLDNEADLERLVRALAGCADNGARMNRLYSEELAHARAPVELGCADNGARMNRLYSEEIRVSLGLDNDEADLERLVRARASVAQTMGRG